ncbi:unnamed protein product [Danaus chrysippus]|uniref:(African queen) hypothetical protein n=1 Tax=Danaus chrysippus TaxID=151541 RepID=A0A8J2QN37_9NEOP|nr:unnamed protein product [Danaus chrysippus]
MSSSFELYIQWCCSIALLSFHGGLVPAWGHWGAIEVEVPATPTLEPAEAVVPGGSGSKVDAPYTHRHTHTDTQDTERCARVVVAGVHVCVPPCIHGGVAGEALSGPGYERGGEGGYASRGEGARVGAGEGEGAINARAFTRLQCAAPQRHRRRLMAPCNIDGYDISKDHLPSILGDPTSVVLTPYVYSQTTLPSSCLPGPPAGPLYRLQSRHGVPSAFFCLDPSCNPILHACALFNF